MIPRIRRENIGLASFLPDLIHAFVVVMDAILGWVSLTQSPEKVDSIAPNLMKQVAAELKVRKSER